MRLKPLQRKFWRNGSRCCNRFNSLLTRPSNKRMSGLKSLLNSTKRLKFIKTRHRISKVTRSTLFWTVSSVLWKVKDENENKQKSEQKYKYREV